ncbi:MAG: rhamnogalacturonan acetylesterase [Paludibacter sp.]|nr:rhamnogalacturonan acetylesterase [Paludibacter sp.]
MNYFKLLVFSLSLILCVSGMSQDINTKKPEQATNKSTLSGEDLLGLKSGADPKKAKPTKAGNSRKKGRPVVFVIGDSTVKNGKGDGSNGQWGWGNFFWQNFDTTKVSIENHALGGRSSRTFITEGLWDKVLEAVQPGDYVLIQFGHNDSGSLNIGRARASLKGNSDKDTTVIMEITGKKETIHTFGWYMRKYASDVKAKKATPILLSHIPRNMFTSTDSTTVIRNTESYGKWTKEAAEMENVPYIDLNSMVVNKYEKMGKDSIQLMYHGDHTHTSKAGALLNGKTVAEGIKNLKNCNLKYLLIK